VPDRIVDHQPCASTAQPSPMSRSAFGTKRGRTNIAAIVDRITFNAHIIETGTQSYRLATSKTSDRKRAS
jgi:hypothetical protein